MVTASGCCTSPLTMYSKNACMAENRSGRRRGCLAGLLDEAGDGVAGLRTLADPVSGAVELEGEILALLERLIHADLLDELAIAGAAAIGHDNAEHRGVLRPDALHANFYCHKFIKRTRRL